MPSAMARINQLERKQRQRQARKLRRRAQGQLGTDGAAAPSLEAARA